MSQYEQQRLAALRAEVRAMPEDLGARRRLAEWLERHGFDGRALMEWHNLFGACRARELPKHAAVICRAALRLRPRHVQWRVRLACCLLRMDMRMEAAHHLEVAMHHAVHPADIRVVRGLWMRVRLVQTLAA